MILINLLVDVVENKELENIKEDISELKDGQKLMTEAIIRLTRIEEKVSHNHNEYQQGVKRLHKRVDELHANIKDTNGLVIKIIVGVGGVVATALLGILIGAIKI